MSHAQPVSPHTKKPRLNAPRRIVLLRDRLLLVHFRHRLGDYCQTRM